MTERREQVERAIRVGVERAQQLADSLNYDRRQLAPEEQRERRQQQRLDYLQLRKQGLSQKEASGRVGVSRQAGQKWETQGEGNNATGGNVSTPDLRIKIPKGNEHGC